MPVRRDPLKTKHRGLFLVHPLRPSHLKAVVSLAPLVAPVYLASRLGWRTLRVFQQRLQMNRWTRAGPSPRRTGPTLVQSHYPRPLVILQVLLSAALATTSPTSPGNLLHDPLTRDDARIAAEHVATGPPMLSPTTRLARPDPDAYIFDAWQHSSSGTSRGPCLRGRLQKPTTRDGQLGHDIARETMQTLSFVQDVLLQIKEDILDRISCTTTRAVLALDIKGAFDNVSHMLVFDNLASTGCGPRMYDYVRDFLSNWMATIGVESIRTSTIPIPSKGNRRGLVLSPTFGRQDFLEEVIETVQNYLEAGNLQRTPDKSQRDGGAKYTVDRLETTTQVMRMVRRITSRRHGLEESDLIRLTQPLVVSHIACANPYLNLLSRGKGKMDVIIRKGY
ncbi:hypothetical protein ISCGN_007023 [Ixodes scapularis]